jgi:hypothetical protein
LINWCFSCSWYASCIVLFLYVSAFLVSPLNECIPFSQILQLEWADDVELHILKGYGAPINYRMAQALLEDILESMQVAIADRRSNLDKVSELGRLRFAHAETVMPLLCTLGLFQETLQGEDEFQTADLVCCMQDQGLCSLGNGKEASISMDRESM